MEIKLNQGFFHLAMDYFKVCPTLDAFASKDNKQIARYETWELDLEAVGRDTLICQWNIPCWLFTPVPLMTKVLNKVRDENIQALLVCSHWPTLLWFQLLEGMIVEPLLHLPHFRLANRTMDGCLAQVHLEPLQMLHIFGGNMH